MVTVAACGASDDTPPGVEVRDQAGRTCTIPVEGEVTCDAIPSPLAGCTGGTTPCFLLGTTGDAGGPGAICAACCGGSSTTIEIEDCSPLTCEDASDCPAEFGRCVSGNQCRF